MSQQSSEKTSATVTHPLEDIRRGAALSACLRPDTAEIVDAGLTDEDKLELTVEGEEL